MFVYPTVPHYCRCPRCPHCGGLLPQSVELPYPYPDLPPITITWGDRENQVGTTTQTNDTIRVKTPSE